MMPCQCTMCAQPESMDDQEVYFDISYADNNEWNESSADKTLNNQQDRIVCRQCLIDNFESLCSQLIIVRRVMRPTV